MTHRTAGRRARAHLRAQVCGLALLVCLGANARPADQSALPTPAELEAAGLLIGGITIDNQNIFNLSDPREDKALFRLANRLHYRTRVDSIRQQLLFRSGDRFSERLLEESERILRADRYFYDASIRPVAIHDGRVDIVVTTRDVWTLNPGVSFGRHGGKNTTGIELEELNLLGTGMELSVARKSSVDRDETRFAFRDPHVHGTWWDLQAQYSSASDGSLHWLALERPFYALDTRWATGAQVFNNDRVDSLYDLGNIVDQFRDHQRFAEAYGGWSRGLRNGWVQRWRFGATYDERQFDVYPAFGGTSAVPGDRKFVYPWVQFDLIQDDFLKLRNRDQIERTEDFFLGARASLRIGWAAGNGGEPSALMYSGSLGHGAAISERSTLLSSVDFSGRYQQGAARNALFDGSMRYYVKQSDRLLLFATLEGSYGNRLDLDNQLLLGGDNGLRGYPLRYQGGNARALLTVEQRYFSRWYPFRLFRVGAAAFFDIGRTWGAAPLASPSLGLLKDVGVGLRFGNSRSGLGNVIHVDVAFPLDGDPSIKKVQFLVETRQRF
jgi:outer membrane protein assembly factor BamA